MGYDVRGEGTPLILFCGLGCDGRMWDGLLSSAKTPFKAIVPHIWKAESILDGARMACDGLDEIGEARALVAGLSMGGYCTFEFIRHFPERAMAAALLDTTAYPDTPQRFNSRNQTLRILSDGGYDKVLKPFLDFVVYEKGFRAVESRKLIDVMAREMGAEGYARSLTAIRDRDDLRSVLAEADIPLLFISGEHDHLSPIDLSRKMAEEARDGRAMLIPDAGHMTAIENHPAVADAFDDFFSKFVP